MFALGIDCRSPLYREEENHLDVARSSLQISSICDDAIPFRTIDKSEDLRTKNVVSATDFEQFICVCHFRTIYTYIYTCSVHVFINFTCLSIPQNYFTYLFITN